MKKYALPLILISLTSCAGYHLRKGEEAFDRMAYRKAERHYAHVLDRDPSAELLVHAAECARALNELGTAAERFQRADGLSALQGEQAMHYAQVLMGSGRKNEAATILFRILSASPENSAAEDLLASCQMEAAFYADTQRYVINELVIPGVKNVFSATPFQKGLLVVGEQDASGAKANPWNGNSFMDLYYSEKHTVVTWSGAKALRGQVNGPWHEGPAVVTRDGGTLYFTRSNYFERKLGKDAGNTSHLKLFRATRDNEGQWTDIRAFSFNGEDFSTGHPALSSDGRTLYFASDRPGGLGGSDIWMSTDLGTGWSEPVNLGPAINTPGNELFPTVNGTSLYFSSAAHENLGGLDIFESHREGDEWSRPKNLGAPVNTVYDDFGFVLDSAGGSGYLSSNRSGSDRVYAFMTVEPVFFVEGMVQGDSVGFLENAQVELLEMATGEDQTVFTDANGHFRARLKANQDYTIRATHQNMITESRVISTKGLPPGSSVSVDFDLRQVTLGRSLAVENIYFDYDRWEIRPEAAQELDKLARLFLDNPELTFELSSHTDCRGGDIYNLVLSDARANSTVNYLIQQGVPPQRVVARGYGEEQLTNHCANGVKCTEEEHQANRRTEFKVLEVSNVAKN